MLEAVAEKIPGTEKVMLTCFRSNEKAMAFYEKMGYGKDEFSPPPRILRNGAIVESEYVWKPKLLYRDAPFRRAEEE
ncbi:hypothetical protein HYFRA_00004035 [Hymenoscyphus fraxineus]|uniref:N-acetyltransferase domain-containing protein n=1 Tax=Hymenoscyphus fraxineus TaxID=746836 RepID=A0A9N9PPR6_9HELO|nr:hypothetical protein HYFRA_00004035 [Hymenoscyphus fraxineus]